MSRVLVVDDNTWQREHLVSLLERAGHSVKSAGDAIAAMEMIDDRAPEVILLDMLLPGANGLTLLHELRTYEDLARIPIVVCSSLELPRRELAPYGVVDVLDKAVMQPRDVVAAVEGALR